MPENTTTQNPETPIITQKPFFQDKNSQILIGVAILAIIFIGVLFAGFYDITSTVWNFNNKSNSFLSLSQSSINSIQSSNSSIASNTLIQSSNSSSATNTEEAKYTEKIEINGNYKKFTNNYIEFEFPKSANALVTPQETSVIYDNVAQQDKMYSELKSKSDINYETYNKFCDFRYYKYKGVDEVSVKYSDISVDFKSNTLEETYICESIPQDYQMFGSDGYLISYDNGILSGYSLNSPKEGQTAVYELNPYMTDCKITNKNFIDNFLPDFSLNTLVYIKFQCGKDNSYTTIAFFTNDFNKNEMFIAPLTDSEKNLYKNITVKNKTLKVINVGDQYSSNHNADLGYFYFTVNLNKTLLGPSYYKSSYYTNDNNSLKLKDNEVKTYSLNNKSSIDVVVNLGKTSIGMENMMRDKNETDFNRVRDTVRKFISTAKRFDGK